MSEQAAEYAIVPVDKAHSQVKYGDAIALRRNIRSMQPQWIKDCTDNQLLELATMSLAYGLDPLQNELTVYRGRPYITIDGRMRKARESGKWHGIVEDRPATPEEYKALKMDPEKDTVWYVSIQHADWVRPSGAFGRVSKHELRTDPNLYWDKRTPAEKDPCQMARKRALYRCLREAFGVNLPGVYDDERVATTSITVLDADSETAQQHASKEQIGAIHAAVKGLRWSDEQYRAWLEKRTGVKSAKDLAYFEAQDVLNALGEMPKAADPEMVKAACEAFGDFGGQAPVEAEFTEVKPEPNGHKQVGSPSSETSELQQVKAEFMALFNECAALGLRPRTLSSLGKEPPISSIKAAISEMLDAKSAKA